MLLCWHITGYLNACDTRGELWGSDTSSFLAIHLSQKTFKSPARSEVPRAKYVSGGWAKHWAHISVEGLVPPPRLSQVFFSSLSLFLIYFFSSSLLTERCVTWALSLFCSDCNTWGLHVFRSMRLLIVSDKWWVIIIFNQRLYCSMFTKYEENI